MAKRRFHSRSRVRPPLVSVVIPCYNGGRYLHEALDSVLAQSFCDIEIIVVDDGSTDDSRRVAGRYASAGVQCVAREHAGNAAARNWGIRKSRGQWVCFLDADDRWAPRKLELQLNDVLSHPPCRVNFPGGRRFFEDGTVQALPLGPRVPKNVWKRLVWGQPYSSSLSGVMIHRECFEVVGGFDEELELSVDWDMWIRLATRYTLRCFPEVLVDVRVHPGGANRDAERRLRMYLKCLLKHHRLFCTVLGMRREWEQSFGLRLMKYGRYLLRCGQYGRSVALISRALRHGGRHLLLDKLKLLGEGQLRCQGAGPVLNLLKRNAPSVSYRT